MTRYDQVGLKTLVALGAVRVPTSPAAARRPTYTGPRPNAAVGAFITSPAEAQARLKEVNLQINSLDSEIKTNVIRPAFLATWNELRGNWQKFYDDHQSYTTIFLTGTGTVERKANEYQAQLSNWYYALKQENPNARLVFPPPLPPNAPLTGASVPWWGISLLTLAGTGFLAYISYASYLYTKEALAKKKFVEEEVVPRVLQSRGITPTRSGMISALTSSRNPAVQRDLRDPAYVGASLSSHPAFGTGSDALDDDHDYVFPGGLYGAGTEPYTPHKKQHVRYNRDRDR